MWDLIIRKLGEKTTWIGIVGLVTAAGVAISPELSDAIANVGLAIASLALVWFKEKK